MFGCTFSLSLMLGQDLPLAPSSFYRPSTYFVRRFVHDFRRPSALSIRGLSSRSRCRFLHRQTRTFCVFFRRIRLSSRRWIIYIIFFRFIPMRVVIGGGGGGGETSESVHFNRFFFCSMNKRKAALHLCPEVTIRCSGQCMREKQKFLFSFLLFSMASEQCAHIITTCMWLLCA